MTTYTLPTTSVTPTTLKDTENMQKFMKHYFYNLNKLIIFDMDNTIINSNETIYKSTQHALQQLGYTENISLQDFELHAGHDFIDIFKELGISIPDMTEFYKIYRKKYFEIIKDTSTLFPETLEILNIIKNTPNYFIALFTTKSQESAEQVLQIFDIAKYFDIAIGSSDVFKPKPDPEVILHLIKGFDVAPENTIMVGDSINDIKCGKSAEVYSVYVNRSSTAHDINKINNISALADKTIDNLLQLKDIL